MSKWELKLRKAFKSVLLTCVLISCIAKPALSVDSANIRPLVVEEVLDSAEVPSGFSVGFSLLTSGNRQYVAYYDKDRRMTVASRHLDSNTWQYQVLPTQVGWDSHNYITMAVDRDGHLHVSGNMHVVKLIYFRTEKPGDITTLKRYAKLRDQPPPFLCPKQRSDSLGDRIGRAGHATNDIRQ